MAQQLSFDDIVDALKSKSALESDPTVPLFKSWLISLGAGEYSSKFIEAGYDLPFVAKHGLSDRDLDCVGIPVSKMGLRRKISELHLLERFYTLESVEDGEDDDDDDDDDGDDDDGDDDDEDD